MKHKTETIHKIIAIVRKNRVLNKDHLNPSMIEVNPKKDGINCKEVSFIVEWQMEHNESKCFPKQKHIEEYHAIK